MEPRWPNMVFKNAGLEKRFLRQFNKYHGTGSVMAWEEIGCKRKTSLVFWEGKTRLPDLPTHLLNIINFYMDKIGYSNNISS